MTTEYILKHIEEKLKIINHALSITTDKECRGFALLLGAKNALEEIREFMEGKNET